MAITTKTLILHPTPTAQWHALVSDAKKISSIKLTDNLESYLVFLLMRFVGDTDVAHSVLAIDFLESLEKLGQARLQKLRDVGDKCLLVAGLFPGQARKRRVRISYFVKLGQNAYSSLSKTRGNELAILFAELCDHFVGLMDILQTMRELEATQTSLDPLQAEELWSDTHSPHALQTLRQMTQGFLISSEPFSPFKH